MKRRAFKLIAFLLAGAIINVAVAWGCAMADTGRSVRSPGNLSWPKSVPPHWPPTPDHAGRTTRFGYAFNWWASAASEVTVATIEAGWPCLSFDSEINFMSNERFGSIRVNVPYLGVRMVPYGLLWPGFAINTIFYAAVLWVLFAVPFKVRRWRRIKRGQCASCGYSLRGTPDIDTCPECGATS